MSFHSLFYKLKKIGHCWLPVECINMHILYISKPMTSKDDSYDSFRSSFPVSTGKTCKILNDPQASVCMQHLHLFMLYTTFYSMLSAFYMDGWWVAGTTTSIFILAAITDWLDGYIARKVFVSYASYMCVNLYIPVHHFHVYDYFGYSNLLDGYGNSFWCFFGSCS